MKICSRLVLCLAWSCLGSASALATPRLPALFSDNMVLQRGMALPIWGWADSGELVTVEFAGQQKTARAGADGKWQVRLDPLAASPEPRTMTVCGSNGLPPLQIQSVLVGEVWLCTGPSNIFWPVSKCDRAKQEIAAADFPGIRFFTVARATADRPQENCAGVWTVCSPETVGPASAAGYFFARRLHQELQVPVALVQSFWGGSRIEAWTSREALEAEPALRPILDYWQDQVAKYDPAGAEAEYNEALEAWRRAVAGAKAAGGKPPARPKPASDPRGQTHRPACLFNAMIAPLIPFGMRGAITYQGLGNLFWAQHSRAALATLIADWRARWGQGDFPFGMIQPAPYTCENWAMSSPDAYSIQRESQLEICRSVPNTGLALTMDVDATEILHFPQKQLVGKRLAAWALSRVYGKPAPFLGPEYQSLAVEKSRLRVVFKNAPGGLMTLDGRPPAHFTVAGADQVYHPAEAVIDGSTVVVHSPAVPAPVSVRFAWGNTDVVNLGNRDRLPASLFRSSVTADR